MNDSAFDDASEAFLSWLTSQTDVKLSQKIALHDYSEENGGRGVTATGDICKDDLLFSIPRTLLLSWQNSTLKERLILDDLAALGDWNLLILAMLYENGMTQSRWREYLKILPSTFSTPMFWSSAEVAELQGSTLRQKIGREEADESYRTIIQPILQRNPDLFDPAKCGLDQFHRMGSLIMAYSFDSPLEPSAKQSANDEFSSDDSEEEEGESFEKVMCPLADLLNADSQQNNARLFYQHDSLDMRATQAIRAGQQVYNTYGDLPNSDLLRRYGYTQVVNPFDVAEIPGDEVTLAVAMTDAERVDRVDYLLDAGLLDDAFDLAAESDGREGVKQIMATLQVLDLPRAEFDALLSDGDGADGQDPPKARKSARNKALMLDILGARLARYETDMASDERLLRTSEMPSQRRNAITVRLGEKRILHRARDAVLAWQVASPPPPPVALPTPKRAAPRQEEGGRASKIRKEK